MSELSCAEPETDLNKTVKEDIYDYADLILDYLHQIGVEFVFGVPGGEIEPLFNALARSGRKGKIKTIVARHECGAAFMADGYYRETGKLGVVCSTTGPGATNLITGVISSAVDNSPILVITAQTAMHKFGKSPLQDSSEPPVDTVSIFNQFTKFSTLVSHEDQLEDKFISALIQATQTPCGPTHLSIPSNILRCPHSRSNSNTNIKQLLTKSFSLDIYAVNLLADEIRKAKNVVFFLGYGCESAYSQIEKLSEILSAPFVCDPMGKSWVNEKHRLYHGIYGFAGQPSAYELFEKNDVDLLVIIGTTISELGIGNLINEFPNERMVHIDSKVQNFSRTSRAKLHVEGHVGAVFDHLLDLARSEFWDKMNKDINPKREKNMMGSYVTLISPEKCLSNLSPITPQKLMSDLSNSLPDRTRVFIDVGNIWAWATHYFTKPSNAGLYRISMGFSSMAWGIGAVIGSACAKPKEPHVCLAGDGAWLMSSHEIGVAVQNELPILFVVLNDSGFGMVRFGQELNNAESIGCKLNKVDFAMLAKAQGADSYIIESPEQLSDIDLDSIFSNTVPTLLDVRIDSNEIPPMMQRIKDLKNISGSSEAFS